MGCFGRIVQGECSVIKSEVCFKGERAYKGEDIEESREIDEDWKKNERAEERKNIGFGGEFLGTCWENQLMFVHRCCSPFLCSKMCSYGYGEGMVRRRKKIQLS